MPFTSAVPPGSGLYLVPGGVGVTVNKEVDALYGVQKVNGTVADRLAVDTQMAKAHDDVAAGGLQRVHLILGDFEHGLTGGERHAFDLAGVGLCGGLRGFQTEHANFLAAGVVKILLSPKAVLPLYKVLAERMGNLAALDSFTRLS